MDSDFLERILSCLPPYLSETDKRAMLEQLSKFPDNYDYFGTILGESAPVQGDTWKGLIAYDFESGERQTLIGIILSNSCDIAGENRPDSDQRVIFAPLLDMDLYAEFLRAEGKQESDVRFWLGQVRRQENNRIFYLPPMHGVYGESLVLLDAVHSMPLRKLREGGITRQFSLSMYGWYVFLIKLSIHFTRTTEGVPRPRVQEPTSAGP